MRKQVQFFKRIIKALDQEVNVLAINRRHIHQVIKNLKGGLKTLLVEIEKEKKASRRALNFEFETFFEECKKRRKQIEGEIEENETLMKSLILELKERFNEQKKYENLLSKTEEKINLQNKLNEQKGLDELTQERYRKHCRINESGVETKYKLK